MTQQWNSEKNKYVDGRWTRSGRTTTKNCRAFIQGLCGMRHVSTRAILFLSLLCFTVLMCCGVFSFSVNVVSVLRRVDDSDSLCAPLQRQQRLPTFQRQIEKPQHSTRMKAKIFEHQQNTKQQPYIQVEQRAQQERKGFKSHGTKH